MTFYKRKVIKKVAYLWSTGMDVETICDVMGMLPDNVNEIIDLISAYY